MNLTSDTNGCSTATRLVATLAGALLVTLSTLTVLQGTTEAGTSGSRGGEDNDTSDDDGDWAVDDEVIGTLPSLGDPDDDDELLQLILLEEPPCFYVQAPAEELLRTIVSAASTSWDTFQENASFTTYEYVPTSREGGLGDLRITFHGSADLAIDAALLQVEGAQFGLALGANPDAFAAGIVLGQRVLSTTVMDSGEDFPVPFASLLEHGLLDRVQIMTSGGKGVRTVLDVEVQGGLVSIGQQYLRSAH